MADDATTGDAAKTAARDALEKVLEALAPAPTPDEPPAPAGPVDEVYGAIGAADVSDSAKQAIKAVERYRNAMRWLVAAVAAIGVALFGSVAFTEGELTGARLGGLVGAALGLVLILLGATWVFEPEDASLGELAESFQEVGEPRVSWSRRAETKRLQKIIEREKTAHLGIGVTGVLDLIHQIGELEGERRDAAADVLAARRALADRTEQRVVAGEALTALVAARQAVAGDMVKAQLDRDIGVAATTAATTRRDEDEARRVLTERLAALAVHDVPLGTHMLHRSVLLDESGISQMRGTFRTSRVVLLLGAFVTLLGALVYLSGVKGDDAGGAPASAVRIGTLEVTSGTEVAELFEEDCTDVTLDVTHFGADRPAEEDGFAITVVRPSDCAATYSVPKGHEDDIDLRLSRSVAVPEEEGDAAEEGGEG